MFRCQCTPERERRKRAKERRKEERKSRKEKDGDEKSKKKDRTKSTTPPATSAPNATAQKDIKIPLLTKLPECTDDADV